MKKPVAIEIEKKAAASKEKPAAKIKSPTAFDLEHVVETPAFDFADEPGLDVEVELPKRPIWSTLFWSALAFLISLGIGLALERLINDLFARYPALGWVGLGTVIILLLALFALILREIFGVMRLKKLQDLRKAAQKAHDNHQLQPAKAIAADIYTLYQNRPDCARFVAQYQRGANDIFDAEHVLPFAERELISPLDKKAQQMIAASARRIALVTSVSPRALVDIGFVLYESLRLSRRIATLYGARPGFLGFLTLSKAILAHLALTGGLAIGDSILQQLLGHGIAARLSSKLGEGVINGLMTVRVGIAAMRVTRPLPWFDGKAPTVNNFLPDLVKLTGEK